MSRLAPATADAAARPGPMPASRGALVRERLMPPGRLLAGTGLLLTAVLLACIPAYTYNVPIAEDWHMVPPLTGHEPQLWQWLWAQNNEHRLPLPRLLLLGVLQGTGDFRAGMVVNVLLMAAIAFLLVRLLASLRGGRLRYTDLFIPIALLHLGNWENFMWAWQFSFVLGSAVALVLLVALAGAPFWTSRWRPAVAGAGVAALPLCGANGLALAAPLCAWLVIESLLVWRRGRAERRAAGWVLGGTMLALAAALYYLVGYTSASWNPPTPGIMATLKTAVAFLAMGFGPSIVRAPLVASLVLLAVVVPAGLLVLREVAASEGDARLRALRLLSYAGGMALLALLFGWGRAGLVPSVGLPDRYVLLAVPLIVWTYIVLEIYAGTLLRRTTQGAMLAVALLLLPWNVRDGLDWRDWYREGMQAVIADLQAGVPREVLVERHGAFLMHWSPERLDAGMQMLHRAGIGPFAPPSPP